MVDLIISIDDKLNDEKAWTLGSRRRWERLHTLLNASCDAFTGLQVPGGGKIQLKLNTILRVLGHDAIWAVERAELDLFADYKMPADVLDTMFADMRALTGYSCLKRLTFRVESQVGFLSGRGEEKGACALMPHTQFLPVGPLTDLPDEYYAERMGLHNGRPEAMRNFGEDVNKFGGLVRETICSPKDIALFNPNFWKTHKPVTPAVRPVGLGGNEANNKNAFNVADAISAGSSGLIIGSPIMGAQNKRQAAELVIEQMGEALAA